MKRTKVNTSAVFSDKKTKRNTDHLKQTEAEQMRHLQGGSFEFTEKDTS